MVYVATTGNDLNDGTAAAAFVAFVAFAQANAALEAGDTLFIEGGVYRQTLHITQSGTVNNLILVRPLDDDAVLIKGTDIVDGWNLHSGGIYSTSVQMNIDVTHRQLYDNDELMQIARWPNDSDNNVHSIDAHELTQAGTASSINGSGFPNEDLSGAFIWYLGQHSGTNWTREISASSSSTINFTDVDIERWPFKPHNSINRIDGVYGRFYVFGALPLLDTEPRIVLRRRIRNSLFPAIRWPTAF